MRGLRGGKNGLVPSRKGGRGERKGLLRYIWVLLNITRGVAPTGFPRLSLLPLCHRFQLLPPRPPFSLPLPLPVITGYTGLWNFRVHLDSFPSKTATSNLRVFLERLLLSSNFLFSFSREEGVSPVFLTGGGRD